METLCDGRELSDPVSAPPMAWRFGSSQILVLYNIITEERFIKTEPIAIWFVSWALSARVPFAAVMPRSSREVRAKPWNSGWEPIQARQMRDGSISSYEGGLRRTRSGRLPAWNPSALLGSTRFKDEAARCSHYLREHGLSTLILLERRSEGKYLHAQSRIN